MAQSVEHVIGNDEVISSILITSSKIALAIAGAFFVSFRMLTKFLLDAIIKLSPAQQPVR